MDLNDYIDLKINHLADTFAEEFLRSQMFQDYEKSSQISRRLIKAKEQKILLMQRFDNDEIEEAKKVVDSMAIFDIQKDY